VDDESVAMVAQGYDAVYQAVPDAPTLWRIWLEHAVGPDYPQEFAHISFTTIDQLRDIADALRLADGDTLVDLACGMGGPSLWIASQHPIRVVGVDASAVAIEQSRARATRCGLSDRSEYHVGTFASTGVTTSTAAAALSLDALQYAPSKQAAFSEAARILKPRGRIVFTAFEVHGDRVAGLPVLGDDPIDDYQPLLEAAGFTVDRYEEIEGWNERVTAAYEAIMQHADVLESEMGADAFGALSLEVALTLERKPYRRRVLAIAARAAATVEMREQP
jgi:ubiquinone/menaquinone biosynthesis C-methylase UbiE